MGPHTIGDSNRERFDFGVVKEEILGIPTLEQLVIRNIGIFVRNIFIRIMRI